MMRVLCSESELAENGETVAVGDRVSRPASRVEHASYGTELDAVEWRFDRYADAVGHGAAIITGTVHAISAVYVEMTQLGDCTWTAALGTAHREPLPTTADTRRPEERIDWEPASEPDASGFVYRGGYARIEEGDERLSGWEITLEDATITPA